MFQFPEWPQGERQAQHDAAQYEPPPSALLVECAEGVWGKQGDSLTTNLYLGNINPKYVDVLEFSFLYVFQYILFGIAPISFNTSM